MPFHQSGPALYAPPTVIHDVDQPERVWNLSTNPKFDHWAAYGNAGAPSAPRLSAAPARSYAVTHSWTNWPSDWSLTQPMHCPHSSHIAPSPQIQLHQQVEQELLQAHRLSQSSARMEPLTSVRQVQMPFEHRHGQPVPPVAASVRLADSMQAWSEGTSPPSAALVEKARPPFASAASEILNLANVTTGLVIMLSDRLAEGILTDKSNPPHAGPLFVPSTGPLNEVLNFGSQAFCVPQEQSAKFLSLQLHDEELAPVNLASLPGTLEEPRAVMVLHEFVKKLLSQTVSYPNALFLGIFYISQVPTFLERQPHALREFERIFLKPQYSAPFKLLTLGLMMSNKHLDDNTFLNRTWHEVTGIPLAELNEMERFYLALCNYRLSPTNSVWTEFIGKLSDFCRHRLEDSLDFTSTSRDFHRVMSHIKAGQDSSFLVEFLTAVLSHQSCTGSRSKGATTGPTFSSHHRRPFPGRGPCLVATAT